MYTTVAVKVSGGGPLTGVRSVIIEVVKGTMAVVYGLIPGGNLSVTVAGKVVSETTKLFEMSDNAKIALGPPI